MNDRTAAGVMAMKFAKRECLIIAAGFLLAASLVLFPPWFRVVNAGYATDVFVGHAPLWSPPITAMAHNKWMPTAIGYKMLIAEWVAIAFTATASIILNRVFFRNVT